MYDQFYQFTGRPFQLTPDPQFYFESVTHRKAMSYLGYGLAQGEGFIVITGEIGAGKTTLVGHLMATIDPQRLTAVKIVSTKVGGDDILRLAAQSFGIATETLDKAQTLGRIEAYLHHQARAGRRTLLIVDEAQNLGADALEELRMLSNFQLGGHSLLQIFLLGQPEFRDLVQRSTNLEQLRQRVIATHHLETLQPEEVAPYIEHRLRVVGWAGNPRFTPDAYDLLALASAGVPRRLNALVSRVLLLGAIDQLDIIDERVVEAVVADLGIDLSNGQNKVASAVLDEVTDEAVATGAPPAPAPVPELAVAPATFVPEPVAFASAPSAFVPEPVAAFEPVSAPAPTLAPAPSMAPVSVPQPAAEVATPPVAPAAPSAPSVDPSVIPALEARIAQLETQSREQDEVLRRVLAKLIEWVERDASAVGPFPNRAA
jgi:general secretion pathway protein A